VILKEFKFLNMRIVFVIISLLFVNFIFCQSFYDKFPTVNEIEKNKKYLFINNFNPGSSRECVFVLYQDLNNKWIAKLYTHTFEVKKNEPKYLSKVENLIHANFSKLWLNIAMTDIEYLPKFDDIEYKLGVKKIINEDGFDNIVRTVDGVDHDTCYTINYKDEKKKNDIKYCDFYTNLEYNPDIDELISVNKLIKLVEEEFKIDL
jgi:hypothetical protein